MEQRGKHLKLLLFALFGLLLLTAVYIPLRGYLAGAFDSPESLKDYLLGFGPLAPVILFSIQTIIGFFPIFPSMLGFAAGAGIFGIWGGFLCNYLGICLGSVIAYLLARRFGAGFVRQIIPEKKYNAAVNWATSKKSYTTVFFLSILLPLAPDCILCYFSGLIGMPAKKYVSIILVAKPWCILAYSIFFGLIL